MTSQKGGRTVLVFRQRPPSFFQFQRPDPSTKMRPANLSHTVNFSYLCNHTSHSQMASGFHVVLAFPVAMMRKAIFLPWNPPSSQNDNSPIYAEKVPQIQKETPLRPPLAIVVTCKYPRYGSMVEIQAFSCHPRPQDQSKQLRIWKEKETAATWIEQDWTGYKLNFIHI